MVVGPSRTFVADFSEGSDYNSNIYKASAKMNTRKILIEHSWKTDILQ